MSNKLQQSSGKQKVAVLFIQDRSGSMSNSWSEVLKGYEEFVKGLKKGDDADKVDYLFSLTTFDTIIDTPIKGAGINQVHGKELENYGPRGCTALYDAVGKTLAGSVPPADKYICVIVTDGYENASREWTKDSLHAAIDAKIKLGNWTFTYLGTQPETWADATSIGVGVGATATYDPTRSHATYSYMAQTVKSFASSPVMSSANLMTDNRFADSKTAEDIGMVTTTTKASNSASTPPSGAEWTKKSSKSWR